MHARDILEQTHTLSEMREILDRFAEDRVETPDSDVHRRRGLSKDMIEEYAPLYQLARVLKGFRSAKLSAAAFSGPDAQIQLEDGSEVSVQITTAGQSHSIALQRELLSQGQSVFPNQQASKASKTSSINVSGRALTTKKANTELMIQEFKLAVANKIAYFIPGTNYLLVAIRQSPLSMEKNWVTSLKNALSAVDSSQYEAVYAATLDGCAKVAGA